MRVLSVVIAIFTGVTVFLFFPASSHAYGDSYASRQIEVGRELDVVEAMDSMAADKSEDEDYVYQASDYQEDDGGEENVVTAQELSEAFGNETRARMDAFQGSGRETALPRDTDAPVLQQTYDSLGLKTKLTRKIYATFGAQWGKINGDVRYHIKFDEPVTDHGESELDWPLNNNLLGLVASINLRRGGDEEGVYDRARIQFSGFFWKFDGDSGSMQDSDWFEDDIAQLGGGWNHPGKDIYSTSDASLDKVGIYDVSYTQNFWLTKHIAVGPLAGYRYQQFNFTAANLDQVGYGPYALAGYTVQIPGRDVITYQFKSQMPYLGVSAEMNWKDKFSLLVNYAYSPWVHVKDTDHHLLRDIITYGDADGKAYLYSIKGEWRFLPNLSLGVGALYEHIKTKGTMDQYQVVGGAEVPIGSVGLDVTSRYWLFSSDVKYRF